MLFLFCSCSFLTNISGNKIKKLYVKYGEMNKVPISENHSNIIRIYFDRFGSIYPDYIINNQIIKDNDSRLNLLFANNENILNQLVAKYNLTKTNNNLADIKAIQTKIISIFTDSINQNSKNKKVVFIIHGFNKHPLEPHGNSSTEENKYLENKINNIYGNEILFVEIYWDGLTAQNGSNFPLKKGINSLKIWDNAQLQSNFVGLELRRILNKINKDTTYVFSHSLGASVITTALFNARKFKPKFYLKNRYGKEIESKYNDNNLYSTPTKYYKVAMIAPAIPGVNTFDDFNDRTPFIDKNIYNNYKFIIGFNENDIVTRKFHLVHAAKLGASTLGCNYKNEVEKTRKKIKNNLNAYDTVNYSYYNCEKAHKQKEHGFDVYVNHEDKTKLLLSKMFGN